MRKIFLLVVLFASYLNVIWSQTHIAEYEDERYMVCTFKGFYNHCVVKRELEDGKWMFFYSDTNTLAVVATIKNKKLEGYYFTYRKDGTMSSLSTYKDDTGNGEYRSYWPNGQLHFKWFEPNGEFLVLDSLGMIIRHEKPLIDTPFRKSFLPLDIKEILKLFNIQDSLLLFYSKDSLFKLVHHSVQNISIYEIQGNNLATDLHPSSQSTIPLIGINREKLLNHLGTDFYIMTESFVDYSLDANGSALLNINSNPNYLLRCCFENDIVKKIFIVQNNDALSFRNICQTLSSLSKDNQNH